MSSSTDLLPVPEVPELAGLRLPQLRPVEPTRAAARAQGYAVGWAEGRRAAEAAVQAEAEELRRAAAADAERRDADNAAAVAALREAAAGARAVLAEACRRVDEQAAVLALELTRTLLGDVVPDPAAVVGRVVGLLPEHPVATVRLHPDVAAVAGDLRDLGVVVVADPTLGPADALAHAGDHAVDLRVDQALARLAEVLR
ncbi:hypothetical protein GCM10009641_33790 [Mycobacterium cookii]|uniref:Flagellar assembly protein FliH/Type III secretion system HrpE domain-containing protein n=1 Tax=Nocardioides furvisabuli TaxID=375542 RepID=A0ABN2WXT6_9ACTN|nr:flagellar assembly protein FliH [Nocardioides furvisabuli]